MINEIHTSCKNCIFAKYEGITQTGCEFNLIDKYKQNNIEVIEAYDHDKEFYIINNRKCIHARSVKWASRKKIYNLESKKKEVEKEIVIKYNNYILCSQKTSLYEIEQTLQSSNAQRLQPTTNIIIVPKDIELNVALLFNQLSQKRYVNWTIKHLIEESSLYGGIDIAERTLKSMHYTVIEAGKKFPSLDIMENLSNKVVNDFFQYAYIDGGDYKIYSGYVHNYYGGHFPTKLEEKLPEELECHTATHVFQ